MRRPGVGTMRRGGFRGIGSSAAAAAVEAPILDLTTGDFSRNLVAYYRTGALTSGTIYAQAAVNTLRWDDHGDTAGALALIEGARTNYAKYSRDRSNGVWSPGSSNTNTSGQAGADGTSVAYREQVGSGGYSAYQTSISPAAAFPACASLWMRRGGADTDYLIVTYDGSLIGAGSATGLTTEWVRDFVRTTTGDLIAIIPTDGRAISGVLAAGARDVISDFPQVESGRFPSSPIVTLGSEVTRPADVLTWDEGDVPADLFTETARFSDCRPEWGYDDIANGDVFWLLSIGGSSNGIRFRKTSGTLKLEVLAGGSVVASSLPLVFDRDVPFGPIVWSPSLGRVSVGGNLGPEGTPWSWDPGDVRVGGIHGGSSEAFCGLSSIYPATFPGDPVSRLVIAVVASQSNAVGKDSLLSGAPGDHGRNDARCYKLNADNEVVTATESLHEGYDPYITGTDGFSFVKVAANIWLDEHTDEDVIIVPRAQGSTRLITDWAISPESVLTTRAINDTIRVLRSSDKLLILVLKGESEALLEGTDASDFAANLDSWLDHFRTRVERSAAPAIICQLPDPGPGYNDWDVVQAEIASLASGSSPVTVIVDNPSSISNLHYSAAEQIALGEDVGAEILVLFP